MILKDFIKKVLEDSSEVQGGELMFDIGVDIDGKDIVIEQGSSNRIKFTLSI